MSRIRKIVEIDEELCDGCGQCILACAEGALEIRDGKARIVKDSYCDGLGACLSGCPAGAVRIIEREADGFDPEAVEEHLAAIGGHPGGEHKEHSPAPSSHQATLAGGEFSKPCACPSSRIETFPSAPAFASNVGQEQPFSSDSNLAHWPIQIRLVPPTAPFLKGADLLVVADCAPVACPDFHRRFLKDKAIMLGCPKFDNAEEYVAKFSEIFSKAGIRSVTVVDMEVPCCSALPMIVKKAMKEAGKEIPFHEIVVSVRGSILKGGEAG